MAACRAPSLDLGARDALVGAVAPDEGSALLDGVIDCAEQTTCAPRSLLRQAGSDGHLEARRFCPGIEEGARPLMPAPQKYSDELRERATRLALESGRPIAHVARDLGIHKEALRTWMGEASAMRPAARRRRCRAPA